MSVLISAVGIAILTGLHPTQFNRGDLWAFAAALAYACVINLLQNITKKYRNTNLIVCLQLVWTLPIPLVFATTSWHIEHLTLAAILAILYCGLIATCLVFYLQTRYQHYVSVTRAAVIYSFEPLIATVAALLIQHQPITWAIVIGGAFMLVSFIVSSLGNRAAH